MTASRVGSILALAACGARPTAPPPPQQQPAFAMPDRQLAESALALDAAAAPLVLVPPNGAIELGGAKVELAELGRRLARDGAPPDPWQGPPPPPAENGSATTGGGAGMGVNPGPFDG